MSHRVTLQPSGHAFDVQEGESILRAGLAAGFAIPFSCKQGVCRNCRAQILSGEVDPGDVHPAYLSHTERAAGLVHLCQATARSDVSFKIREVDGFGGITTRQVPCRIARMERPAPDVTILHLRLPMNENMMFVAGQHIELLLPDGVRRSYSIATKPAVDGVTAIELHIRHVPGGLFSDTMLAGLKERALLRFEGPLGSFALRTDSDRPILLVASGTGFAPIKAMLAWAFEKSLHRQRPISLYWGARTRRDLYQLDVPEAWAAAQPGFRFVPVLSEPGPDCAWQGRTGLVHAAAMQDLPDMRGIEAYACGAPAMVAAARRDFTALCHLPEDAFLADAFLTTADTLAEPAAQGETP